MFLVGFKIKRDKNMVKDFKYNVTRRVAENGHLVLICPDITIESKVNWYKDTEQLNSSFR